MPMKLFWRDYHFQTGFHVGLKKYYVEIYNMKKNKLEEERYDFHSQEEANDYLRVYGYHTFGRYMYED